MGFRPNYSLISILQGLGLTTGLKLCLDAGDAASYTSGQSWLDRSGNGYDFFRGAGSGSGADDPTFNGTPGNLSPSEYWSLDGGDFFRYDSANETWMNNLHKAGAKVTIVAWVYPIAGVNNIVIGTNGGPSVSGTGFHFGIPSTNTIALRVANGTGVSAQENPSVATITGSQWNFIAASIDASTGVGRYQINAAQESFSAFYINPSSGNASFTMEAAGRGNANSPMPNGSRLAMVAVWEGVALTQAQIDSIYKGIITAAAAASGASIATATGRATARSTGVAAGVSLPTAVGRMTARSTGVAAGVSLPTAVGRMTAQSVAVSSGAAVALASGTMVLDGVGAASGAGAAAAVARPIASAIGACSGVATANSFALSTSQSAAVSAGLAAASAVLTAGAQTSGVSSGAGQATGVPNFVAASVGLSSGGSLALAYTNPIFAAVAYSVGSSDAYAVTYTFYVDTEVVCVWDEPRVALVPDDDIEEILVASVSAEDRDALVAGEDRSVSVPWTSRDNDADAKPQYADTLNRKRTC